MSQKPSYFKIGLFVLLVIILLIAGVIAFGAGALFRDTFLIETYVDQSVQGLKVGSPLMQRGVQIGRIEKITFVTKEYFDKDVDQLLMSEQELERNIRYNKYVMVVMSVDKISFPEIKDDIALIGELIDELIKRGLRLKISYQGITGVAFIEADYMDPERFPAMRVPWSPRNFYIPWAPGTLASFKQSAERILQKIEEVDFGAIANNIDTLVSTLNSAVEDAQIAQVRGELVSLLQELRQSNQKLQAMIQQDSGTPATLPDAINQFNATLTKIEGLVDRQQADVEDIIENIRIVSINLRELSEHAKEYPSQMILGSPPPRSEVVE